ncbi:MAG: polyprenol monophosphomannose synthase [Nanoarchaeota archaeon]|nr:polyprenol monophosphomannose synthase [Nanoarchaeota archaeon]MBU4353025.1 polyprenol monophosphomannose synthase [Nanoarchaeota archaeon]
MKQKACIILPTYNEKENINLILDALLKEFELIDDFNMEVLVVDDNSPDKTWETVEKYSQKHPNIHLLLRKKKSGLGSAYIEGINFAIDKLKADFVFNMDADLSHDPKLISKMLEQGKEFNLVIGSRYIKGGGFANWPWYRKLISKGANLFGVIILGLKIKDISSGFRCYSKDIINKTNLSKIESTGYAFLEELLFHCIKNGAKVKEIPLIFVDRTKGETKLNKKEMINFFLTIIRLRRKYGKA